MDNIVVKGARENNLKNIDITLPKNIRKDKKQKTEKLVNRALEYFVK